MNSPRIPVVSVTTTRALKQEGVTGDEGDEEETEETSEETAEETTE